MATDQKIENLLNLALDTTPEEREKSLTLNVGFDTQDQQWDLIVKYSGSLQKFREQGIRVAELANGYAVVTIAQSMISYFSAQPEIEYVEKPKRLFFSVRQGRTASCMDALQITEAAGTLLNVPETSPVTDRQSEDASAGENGGRVLPLLGQGILVAVIDSGVDYTHPDFRNPDGSTRILAIWDQSVAGNPPEGYTLGTEYTKAQIDEALRSGQRLPTRDISGHGTEVLGIAAGNGRTSIPGRQQRAAGNVVTDPAQPEFGSERGVVPLAHILVVKLGNPKPESFPRTTELMQALDYVYRRAQEWRLPVAVNLSFGNVYGPHNGTSLLETYIAELADRWKSVICIGTGNEGSTAGHASGILRQGELREVQMGVASFERTINVQLWKSYSDEFGVLLISPEGQIIGPMPENLGPQRYIAGGTELLVFYGKPSPYSISQEIYFDFLPVGDYIDSGIWRFHLAPRRVVDGRYDMWLPQAEALNRGTRFYEPSVENTLTIPATARNIVAVGAYDSRSLTYAPFSGRGNPPGQPLTSGATVVKPDIVAPGVNIRTTAVGGGYTSVTGTSFATPFATGAAAMLMQWGIVNGNDDYLYGEKVRAYLRRGARPLPGFAQYPNSQVGYGALCVRDSLPV
ncbi:peptidase, S8/S53 family [Marvinbryantia formatexigens DSM 14469]|uniref:Peptidase, S8/S53 family n=1 Tax=Marvinbryantia formatexigens DSM 14469 TaxID=478749 RepID=C6LIC6_9FIRM|nr:S8 family peptidase [Marvinbryantia formatexigens]EET59622.1 peptidase, S8/S53 family [Marvinbryantia formatexigens DSM 14469]UWO26273.1 S8 family serine peptidase [Marvinbryantia formatexigens DSM 14469]SDG09949.1 Subtilase family protein [Marvinbryantia formatexigens]